MHGCPTNDSAAQEQLELDWNLKYLCIRYSTLKMLTLVSLFRVTRLFQYSVEEPCLMDVKPHFKFSSTLLQLTTEVHQYNTFN